MRFVAGLALLLVPLCGGCSSGGSSGGGTGSGGSGGSLPAVTPQTFGGVLAQVSCEGLAQCCSGFDVLSCQLSLGLLLGPVALGGHGQVEWDQAAADQWVAEFSARAKACDQDQSTADLPPVYKPLVADGGACLNDSECIPPDNGYAECVWPPEEERRCVQKPYASKGGSCDVNLDCDPSQQLRCDAGTCQDRSGVGQTCSEVSIGDDCQDGLSCVSGACEQQLADGAACTKASQCGSGACVNGICQKFWQQFCAG